MSTVMAIFYLDTDKWVVILAFTKTHFTLIIEHRKLKDLDNHTQNYRMSMVKTIKRDISPQGPIILKIRKVWWIIQKTLALTYQPFKPYIQQKTLHTAIFTQGSAFIWTWGYDTLT